jgi:hypothetical protein
MSCGTDSLAPSARCDLIATFYVDAHGRLPDRNRRYASNTVIHHSTASCFLLPASCFLLPASCFLLPASCFLLPVSCLPVITAPGAPGAPGDVGVIPRSGLCNLHEKSIFS